MATKINGMSTNAEKKFLSQMGLGKFNSDSPLTRIQCLEGYIKAIPKRVDWGRVDQYIVTIEAKRQLRVEQDAVSATRIRFK